MPVSKAEIEAVSSRSWTKAWPMPSDAKRCHGGSCSRFFGWRLEVWCWWSFLPSLVWKRMKFSQCLAWKRIEDLYICLFCQPFYAWFHRQELGFKQQRCWFNQGENSDLMQLRRPIKDGKALLNRSNIRLKLQRFKHWRFNYPFPWNRFQWDGYLVLY